MAFNGSGTYTPPGPPVYPPVSGAVISSSYFIQLINDMSSALSLTFLRDGSVPLGGDLNTGGNRIKLLSSGTVGSPALNFSADGTSGIYFTAGAVNIAVAGVQVGSFTASGLSGYALLASPTFTGVPAVPTAAPGTNTTQIASTAFVTAAVGGGSYAPLNSPAFTGVPTAPTAAGGTNTTQLATTAYVFGNFAGLASPAFTGTPTAPTAATATNTTQLATTAYVKANLANYAILAGPTFTDTVTITTPGSSPIVVNAASSSASGTIVQLLNTSGATKTGQFTVDTAGLVIFSSINGGLRFASSTSIHDFQNTGGSSFAQITNTGITSNGNIVYHAGNFNPASKADVASPTFTGTASVPTGEIGTRDLPQTTKAAAFSFAAVQRGGHIYYTGAAVAATIDPNSTTAMPVGTAIAIVNNGSGALTITRGAGVTLVYNNINGDRILAIGGMATILKVATDTWFISGTSLS